MKNAQFNNALAVLSTATKDLFVQLYEIGVPLPEGIEVKGNGTGYYDPMTKAFKGREYSSWTFYKAVCPNTGRRMLFAPVKNFTGLTKFDDELCLVFFERYTPNTDSPMVIIEQLSHTNSTFDKVCGLAALLQGIADFHL